MRRGAGARAVFASLSRLLPASILAAGLAGCVVAGPDSDNRVDASLLTNSIAPASGGSQGRRPSGADTGNAIADARALNPYPAAAYPIASTDTAPNAFAGATSALQVPTTARAPATTGAESASDARTVRNAVSVADLADTDRRYEWSNPQTGSSGVISGLTEEREGMRICRRFRTLRQSYAGVSLYSGEACTNGEGEWALVKFVENGSATTLQSAGNT